MPTLLTKPTVEVATVRYIKLGKGGGWTQECLDKGIIRLGFQTEENLDVCQKGDWNALRGRYLAASKKPGSATSRCNQVRAFFEDTGSTLWITFYQSRMYWAFADPARPPLKSDDRDGCYRHTVDGWRSETVEGKPLYESNLSGHLTMAKGYQGTSYEFKDLDYVVRRINGLRSQESARAEEAVGAMLPAIAAMMTRLTEDDFELLVDLIFTSSGWRRMGVTGGTQELMDMELILPSTGARAFVQVKSTAKQREFDEEYREVFQGMKGYERMFYAFHTGDIVCADKNITLLDKAELSKMVLDAGLVTWLIERVA